MQVRVLPPKPMSEKNILEGIFSQFERPEVQGIENNLETTNPDLYVLCLKTDNYYFVVTQEATGWIINVDKVIRRLQQLQLPLQKLSQEKDKAFCMFSNLGDSIEEILDNLTRLRAELRKDAIDQFLADD